MKITIHELLTALLAGTYIHNCVNFYVPYKNGMTTLTLYVCTTCINGVHYKGFHLVIFLNNILLVCSSFFSFSLPAAKFLFLEVFFISLLLNSFMLSNYVLYFLAATPIFLFTFPNPTTCRVFTW